MLDALCRAYSGDWWCWAVTVGCRVRSVRGSGNRNKRRGFIQLHSRRPVADGRVRRRVRRTYSLAENSIRTMVASLRSLVIARLSRNTHFCLPRINCLSLSIAARLPRNGSVSGIANGGVHLHGVGFGPATRLLGRINEGMEFRHSGCAAGSHECARRRL